MRAHRRGDAGHYPAASRRNRRRAMSKTLTVLAALVVTTMLVVPTVSLAGARAPTVASMSSLGLSPGYGAHAVGIKTPDGLLGRIRKPRDPPPRRVAR